MNRNPHTTPLSPEQRRALALQRLEQSRSALILSLSPRPSPAPAPKTANPSPTDGRPSLLSALASRVQRNGLIEGAGRSLMTLTRRWWKRQPWHSSVELVTSTAAHEVRPLIARHPWAALATGAAFGALLMAARPLIWRPLQKQLQPWRGNPIGMVWSQLSQVPVQMALAGALAAWINEASQKHSKASNAGPTVATPPVAASTPSVP